MHSICNLYMNIQHSSWTMYVHCAYDMDIGQMRPNLCLGIALEKGEVIIIYSTCFFILKLNTALDPNLYETCRLVEKMVRSIRRTSTIIHTTLSTYLLTGRTNEPLLSLVEFIHFVLRSLTFYLHSQVKQLSLSIDCFAATQFLCFSAHKHDLSPK